MNSASYIGASGRKRSDEPDLEAGRRNGGGGRRSKSPAAASLMAMLSGSKEHRRQHHSNGKGKKNGKVQNGKRLLVDVSENGGKDDKDRLLLGNGGSSANIVRNVSAGHLLSTSDRRGLGGGKENGLHNHHHGSNSTISRTGSRPSLVSTVLGR